MAITRSATLAVPAVLFQKRVWCLHCLRALCASVVKTGYPRATAKGFGGAVGRIPRSSAAFISFSREEKR